MLGTGLVFVGLAALPLFPAGARLVGVPFTLTALWAGIYVALSALNYSLYRHFGGRSRSYWVVNTLETAVWLYGLIGLAAVSGSLASPWLILVFLGFAFIGATEGLVDPSNMVVICASPIVAMLAYASLGFAAALTAFAFVALGVAAWFMLGRGVLRMLAEQTKREALQERVAVLERELERERIARDLHDSVGSALALVGTYGDLIERHLHKPEELRRISATLREASRDGLGDLRGLLVAIAPTDPSLEGLGACMGRVARHIEDAAEISVDVVGALNLALELPVRLALVRVFQEAINNALRHGRARHIEARLCATGESIALDIFDDGTGFDPAIATNGRGLAGMRARAGELGGSFAIEAAPGRGTRLHLNLPLVART